MTDSFLLAIPADPAPCRAAADGLRSLARTAERAGDHLDTQVTLSAADFSGATARAYRTACGDLRADVRLLTRDARGLADALTDYVDGIREVRQVLHQVRRRAALERLEVVGEEVRLPECPGAAQKEAFWILLGLKNRAHMAASWVESDWRTALERHTGAAPTGLVAYPPLGNWPPEPGDYPYDARVPGIGPGPLAPLEEETDVGRGRRDGRDRRARPEPPDESTDRPDRPDPGDPMPHPDPRGGGLPHPVSMVPVSMVPASVAPLPPLLPLLPDPATHNSCSNGYEGVLT